MTAETIAPVTALGVLCEWERTTAGAFGAIYWCGKSAAGIEINVSRTSEWNVYVLHEGCLFVTGSGDTLEQAELACELDATTRQALLASVRRVT